MLKSFGVPLLWLGLVLCLGTGHFGVQQTAPWLIPLLKTLVPWAPARDLQALHIVLRKLVHLTEYAILGRVWLVGVLAWRAPTVRTASWIALLVCVACAFLDELHQSMLLNRTGSVSDALLDCLGALMMLLMLRFRHEASMSDPAVATVR
jgi:VanZ family protein